MEIGYKCRWRCPAPEESVPVHLTLIYAVISADGKGTYLASARKSRALTFQWARGEPKHTLQKLYIMKFPGKKRWAKAHVTQIVHYEQGVNQTHTTIVVHCNFQRARGDSNTLYNICELSVFQWGGGNPDHPSQASYNYQLLREHRAIQTTHYHCLDMIHLYKEWAKLHFITFVHYLLLSDQGLSQTIVEKYILHY